MTRVKLFTYVRVVSSVIYALSLVPTINTANSFLALFVAIVGTEIVAAFLLFLGLRKLSALDLGTFRRPTLLVGIYVLGALALLPGGGIAFSYLLQSGAGREVPQIVEVASTVVIGGLLGMLVGSFGAMQGLWRIGERYDRSSIRLGAVLFIVPYVNIVSDFLLLAGVHGASTGLRKQIRP